jgi:hypothetical protein
MPQNATVRHVIFMLHEIKPTEKNPERSKRKKVPYLQRSKY